MKSSEDYTKVDINKVRKFMLAKSSVRRKTMKTWEDNKVLPDGWKVKMPEGKNESKETAAMAPSKPKKEKKSEAVTSKFGSTVQVERRSVSPHGLGKVNEPSKISPSQGLSSSDKSLLKAKTMAFPSQHELTQTDAHFKFKDKQKRTNKCVSVQVNPTANSIQNQWFKDKENNQTQPTTSTQPKPGWDYRDKIRAAPGATLGQ